MSALLPYLRGDRVGKVVGITFDDGYQNNLDHAAPVLSRLGFGSTCYAVSDLLGATNRWDASVGVPQVPLMDGAGLRRWCEAGQEIGSHTRFHSRLPGLDDAAARDEIRGARSRLEAETGRPVLHFCYPYGEFEERHLEMVREAGYLTATTTIRGRYPVGGPLFSIPRVPIVRSGTLGHLWVKIATGYEDGKGQ